MKNLYIFSGRGLRCFKNLLLSKIPFFLFILISGFSTNLSAQSTLIVNSTNDGPDVNLSDGICADQEGNCTLRAAIETANQTPEPDNIHFRLNGQIPMVISLTGDLPVITEPVVLDATTQAGYSWATPAIVVDGGGLAKFGFKLEGQSSGSVITGFVMGNFNLMDNDNILGNGTAIYANGTGSHRIKGNFLGVTLNGTAPAPNVFGVALVHSSGNVIGGPAPGDKNVISGNYIKTGWGIGIYIHGENSFNNSILGNYIGTDATGTMAIPNYWGIVTHEGANNNRIGGSVAEARNIISGNRQTGIYILSPDNVVSGNYIGTGKDGEMLVYMGKSRQQGIRIWTGAATGNIIGGLEPGEGNVISGNVYFNGITIGSVDFDMMGNQILGNYIGTDPTGQRKVPNYRGISMTTNSAIVANNIISGNETLGFHIHSSKDVRIYDNLIGTQADGVSPLGNGTFGVGVVNGSRNNIIGETSGGGGNTIAYNGTEGIVVSYFNNIGSEVTTQPIYNTIKGNMIFGNGSLGLDLDSNGISENDLGDADEGANFLQNFPEISEGASILEQVLSLSYKVPSDPLHSAYPITVEFYKSDGNRQGRGFINRDVFTEQDHANGTEKAIGITLPGELELASGDLITATATDANGNTSEFSAEVEIASTCTTQIWYADADGDGFGIDLEETNISSCTKPSEKYVSFAGDCNDNDLNINPEAEDIPGDGIDQNCDGEDASLEAEDTDGDGVANTVDNCPEISNSDQADSNGNGIGDVCETTTCAGTDTLNLSSCVSGSSVYWTVHNPGNCSTTGRWEIRKGSESDTFLINAGETIQFITSMASKGQTQVILYWNDSSGVETKITANASGNSCMSAALSTTETNSTISLQEMPSVYPNPIGQDGFYISFSNSYSGKTFGASIYDLNSRVIAQNLFEVPQGGGNLFWAIDTGSWLPGVYVLNLDHGNEKFQINLLKE